MGDTVQEIQAKRESWDNKRSKLMRFRDQASKMAPKPGADPQFIQDSQKAAADVLEKSDAAIASMKTEITGYDTKIKRNSSSDQPQVDAKGNRIYTQKDVDETLRQLAMLKEIRSAYEAVIRHKDTFGDISRFDSDTAKKNLSEIKSEYQETLFKLAMQQQQVNKTVAQAKSQPVAQPDEQGFPVKPDKQAFRRTKILSDKKTMLAALTRQQTMLDQQVSQFEEQSGSKTLDDQFNIQLAHLRGIHMVLHEKIKVARATVSPDLNKAEHALKACKAKLTELKTEYEYCESMVLDSEMVRPGQLASSSESISTLSKEKFENVRRDIGKSLEEYNELSTVYVNRQLKIMGDKNINLGLNEGDIHIALKNPSRTNIIEASALIQTYRENLDKLQREYNKCKDVIERTSEVSPLQPERSSTAHKKMLSEFEQFGQEIAKRTKTLQDLQVKHNQVSQNLASNIRPTTGL